MRSFLLIGLLLHLALITACGSPPPVLPPEEIVLKTADRMTEMSGFHFVIDRTGAPAYIDPNETLALRSAEGDYVAPDRSRATVRIIAPGLVTDISVISIADIQWETNVLTGKWEALPPNWGFNPTVLFDAEVGLQKILSSDLSNLAPVQNETLDEGPDGELYFLTGQVSGERLYTISGGLIGPDPVRVRMWVAPETFELHRILVEETMVESEEPTVWQVDFTNFDEIVGIEPPLLD